MSGARRPGCPIWCRSSHATSPVHLRNLDHVPRAGGDIEVDLELCQDDKGPFVEMIVTDHNPSIRSMFPDEVRNTYRIPMDIAGIWAHLGRTLDVRGYQEVAINLLVAQEHVLDDQAQRCRFDWCVSDHSIDEWADSHVSTPVRVGDAQVSLLLVDDNPDMLEEDQGGMVRVTFDDGRHHEWSSARADDVAHVLDQVISADKVELVRVLRDHVALLDRAGRVPAPGR